MFLLVRHGIESTHCRILQNNCVYTQIKSKCIRDSVNPIYVYQKWPCDTSCFPQQITAHCPLFLLEGRQRSKTQQYFSPRHLNAIVWLTLFARGLCPITAFVYHCLITPAHPQSTCFANGSLLRRLNCLPFTSRTNVLIEHSFITINE